MRHRITRMSTARTAAAAAGAALLGLGLGACTIGGETTAPTTATGAEATEAADGAGFATAALQTAGGGDAGTVTFAEEDGRITVTVDARGLEPGFHGFHVHGTGKCEPNSQSPDGATGDFMSAGGHLTGDADAVGHGNPAGGTGHAGDLPALLVGEDGTAAMTFTTDRLTRELLLDDDGSAVIVHSGPDNFTHIPQRYAEGGPDEATKKTGDAGDRALCGVVMPSGDASGAAN